MKWNINNTINSFTHLEMFPLTDRDYEIFIKIRERNCSNIYRVKFKKIILFYYCLRFFSITVRNLGIKYFFKHYKEDLERFRKDSMTKYVLSL